MRIKELRNLFKLQQKELASILEISPNTLSQYENGKREPNIEVISKITEYFNVSADFIYGLTNSVRCEKCGLEYSPLIKIDKEIHDELHKRWEYAVKKFGTIYASSAKNEKIKADNRNIVRNINNYSLEERYNAQLEVFRCLFSRSLCALNYSEEHVDYATYVAMLLNKEHTKNQLDDALYNKLVDEYGTQEGIPYGTYYVPDATEAKIIKLQDNIITTNAEKETIRKYRELDAHGKKMVDFTLHEEWERCSTESANTLTSPVRLINYYYRLASAGTGQILFDMPPTERIEIPDLPQYRKVDYAISVNGDSMQPTYYDGDMLLVEMTDEIEIGEIGIFSVDGDCYVKELGNGELISLNAEYNNIPLNETAKCMGRVIDKL